MMTTTTLRSLPLWTLALLAGCDTPADPQATAPTEDIGKGDGLGDDDQVAPTLCAAVRGNGPRLTSHYASLARIVESYGLLDGLAGGSSGSITSYVVDSMHANPAVFECGDEACSEPQQRARMALLLKSFPGYIEALGSSDEATAFGVVSELSARVREAGIAGLLDRDPAAGVEALETLLTSEDLRDLVNPEVFTLLAESPDPAWHARRLVKSLSGGLAFDVQDASAFVQPGVVSFAALAEKLGRIGTFYAGWEPVDADALGGWLDACADDARGLTWAETRALPLGDSTCGAVFTGLVSEFRDATAAGDYPSRLDKKVGDHLKILVTTSVLTGDAVDQFNTARKAYANATLPTMDVSFDDVAFGYWGSDGDLERLEDNRRGFSDAQTERRLALGSTTWREVLSLSPAEPGLSRALEIDGGLVSAGGWSDLFPVRALQNIGCDEVVYVTRRVPSDDGFAIDVATLLGMSDDERDALYSFDVEGSAVNLAVEDAGAVWCTDWDRPEVSDLDGMFADGYSAPQETHSSFFEGAYAGESEQLDIRGCTPNLTIER